MIGRKDTTDRTHVDCELCNDLDLCERCLLRERGCKNVNHEPGVWALYNGMGSVSKEFSSLEDLLSARAVPERHSVDSRVKGMPSLAIR